MLYSLGGMSEHTSQFRQVTMTPMTPNSATEMVCTVQCHHLSYDNAAYAGSDISIACHPPFLYEGSMTSTQ